MLKVTILTENSVRRRGLLAEHGLSFWLELDDCQILFDAGQSDVYRHNAQQLGIDIQKADKIVLSHGHYDHGDGFRFFPVDERGQWPLFYAHPDAFCKRYARNNGEGSMRTVGLNWQLSELPGLQQRLVLNEEIITIAEGTYLCCNIKKQHGKYLSPNFFTKKNGKIIPDHFLDEQIIVSRTKAGLVILLGCCHPGFIDCLHYVNKHFSGEHIHAIMGGFHLLNHSDAALSELSKSMEAFSFDYIMPLHCTGIKAWCLLRQVYAEKCLQMQAGDTFSI